MKINTCPPLPLIQELIDAAAYATCPKGACNHNRCQGLHKALDDISTASFTDTHGFLRCPTVTNLTAFIESHDGCLVESYNGPQSATITVSSETRQADGTITREMEILPATLQAVKAWLGY